jgi:hypothetical protein
MKTFVLSIFLSLAALTATAAAADICCQGLPCCHGLPCCD